MTPVAILTLFLPIVIAGCASAKHTQRDPLAPPPGSNAQHNPHTTPDFEGLGPHGPGATVRDSDDHLHASTTMPDNFNDAARWSQRFDAPERDAWQRPDLVVTTTLAANPKDGLVLVDLGAGTGYFSTRFAKAQPTATIIAADIASSLLHWTARRASEAGLTNIETHQTTESGPAWPESMPKVDIAFLCNVYHHITDRPAWFSKVYAMAKADARLVVIDFTPASKRGPPADHKLAPDAVIQELHEAGWRLDATHDILPDQYFLVFRKVP